MDLECGEGNFQARESLPDTWGDLKADTIFLAPNSFGWCLSGAPKGSLFIDLRPASPNAVVEKWLETPIRFGSGGWLFRTPKENHLTRKLKGVYDGIIFIDRSTPVQPTKMHCTEAQIE